MSKIALQGDASGTGTFTIASPNSNTDRTLTLPDEAGTVLTSASDTGVQATKSTPLFVTDIATTNNYINHNTWTKLPFDNELIDSDLWYDALSNYRFTPQVAGYYLITVRVNFGDNSNSPTRTETAIYKNGSRYAKLSSIEANVGNIVTYSGAMMVYFNGSTDYIELYAFAQTTNSGQARVRGNAEHSEFSGMLVRAD